MIVKAYSAVKPDNALSQFLPRLGELSQLDVCSLNERGSTAGLESFCDAWLQETCQDPSFAAFQRSWVQDTYMRASARFAASVGVTSGLGQLIFYGNTALLLSPCYCCFVFHWRLSLHRHGHPAWVPVLWARNQYCTTIGVDRTARSRRIRGGVLDKVPHYSKTDAMLLPVSSVILCWQSLSHEF